jgi:hypothetical protein
MLRLTSQPTVKRVRSSSSLIVEHFDDRGNVIYQVTTSGILAAVYTSMWGDNRSILEMEIFDEVRGQGDYQLPEDVEKWSEILAGRGRYILSYHSNPIIGS